MQKPNETTMSITNAIDWMSVKLNTPCVLLLFVDVSAAFKFLGVLSIFTTIVYNSIKIYKEIKNKQ